MNQRYYSLDVFRGATVCLMILVNNPGSSFVYSPLDHAPWHGVTPTDLVFPFFLFAVGNAMAFVMPRLEAAGDAVFWRKVIKRFLLIWAIGFFLGWYPFVQFVGDHVEAKGWTWTTSTGTVMGVRILGVLARIAIAYFFASILVYYLKVRGAFLVGVILLLLYWMLCYTLGDAADPYSMTGYFGNAVDKAILTEPHMYHGEGIAFDPEGIMSTIPAIVQVIFGFLVGDYIRKRGKHIQQMEQPAVKGFELYQMLTVLFIAAVGLLFTGYAWGLVFPINKKIWTSSYVAYTSGLAIVVLSTLIYAIEVKQMRGWWTKFFDVFGKNALFIFAFSSFFPKTLWLIRWPSGVNAQGQTTYSDPWHWFARLCGKLPGRPENGSLLFSICVILLFWAICYWMDKKKIYIKV
ncbi:MAG: acyltransferase family protein [Flavisolibacter sp.]